MHALFDWVKNHSAKLLLVVLLTGGALLGALVHEVQAVAYCGFQCEVTHAVQSRCVNEEREPAALRCSTLCRENCASLGMTYDGSRGSSYCGPIDGTSERRCSPCKCALRNASFACFRDSESTNDPGQGNECPNRCNETCSTARYRDRISTNRIGEVRCATSPAPVCVGVTLPASSRLTQCRDCIGRCRNASDAYGSIPSASNCYEGCSASGDSACAGVPQEQAVQGLTGTNGAVSGAGGGRSRIQSGTTASASEAASLPPGACVQRAIAADAANVSLIAMSEATFGAASSTWTCRRVCSEQEQSGCVTGGCPGDASVRCCPPSLGIPPATQCGGRGATTSGAAADGGTGGTAGGTTEGGTTDGSTEGGASNSGTPGSSGTTDSSGGTRSSTVGSSNVAADSGGLTRLILPSCIEDGGCQFSDIIQVGLNLVRFLFGLAGVLLLVVFVYAGIEYLVAGDASSVKTAEERIKKALLGLFFMFFGYTLVNFMVGLFVRA